MATQPFFLNESAGQGIVSKPPGFHFDLNADRDVPQVGDYGAIGNRNKLEAAYGEIDGVYNELVKQGKRSQAFALRDAADKFRRTGAKYGDNSFRRVRALKDLEGSLNIASQGQQAKLMQQKLSDLRGTIGQMSQMSNTAFSQGMQRADFRERKLESLRRSVNASNAMKMRSSQSKRQSRSATRRNPITPQLNQVDEQLRLKRGLQGMEDSRLNNLAKKRAEYYRNEDNKKMRSGIMDTSWRPEDPMALAKQDVYKLWSTPSGVGDPYGTRTGPLSRMSGTFKVGGNPVMPQRGNPIMGGGNDSATRISNRRSTGGSRNPITGGVPQGRQALLNRDTISRNFTPLSGGRGYGLVDDDTFGGVFTDPITGKRSIRAQSRRSLQQEMDRKNPKK